jgi:DNA helicase-4
MGIGIIVSILIVVCSFTLATILYHNRKAKVNVYLCYEFFVRNLHEEELYIPENNSEYQKHKQTYYHLKSIRDKWYFTGNTRDYISDFLVIVESMEEFINAVSQYMGEDHYFSHSEFLNCKKLADFAKLESYVDDDFLKYANQYELKSFSQLDKYLNILHSDISVVAQNHNLRFVKEELEANKNFFDTVMKYPLDQQQRESIVKLEDNALVISSAGSGKTSTMVGKIRYLVECKHISPAKILPLTYGKKASEELTERLAYKDKGLKCYTFHSYAKHIVEAVTKKKQEICPDGLMLQCFYHQAKVNSKFKNAINEFLTAKNSLTKNNHDYTKGEDFMNDRALYGIQAPFLDVDNRIIFTKSEEEKKICTFLSMNNVLFRYEASFPYDTTTEHKRQYKPDFTIWYQQNGRWVYLILEHFGVDKNGNVPVWFGEGKKGGFAEANYEYNAGIEWKRKINSYYHIPLIETTSAMFHDGTVYKHLKSELERYGVPMRPLTEDEKFEKLVVRNKRMEDSLLQLITTFITLTKANRLSVDDVFDKIKGENKNNQPFVERSKFMLYEIFKPVYDDYETSLREQKEIDYTDLILKATELCNEGRYNKEFEYILVDEFQDISIDRFKMLQSLRNQEPLTKLYCVGDDWQSIFRFSGSDLTLFSDFDEYFGFTEKCKIETTYRFGNPLVSISSAFIQKNEKQVKKNIKPVNKSIKTELSLHGYNNDEGAQFALLGQLIATIPQEESIMLIARYHSDSDFIPASHITERNNKRQVTKVTIGLREIPFVTVHAAKGLEADHVILVNCSQDGNGFPSKVSDDPILGYILSKPETYPFAEERRLFYVAITRAKKHSYVLYKEDCPSAFIADVDETNNEKNVLICPVCKKGIMREVKSGETQFANWSLFACTNRTAGCRYTWFVNYRSKEEIPSFFNF